MTNKTTYDYYSDVKDNTILLRFEDVPDTSIRNFLKDEGFTYSGKTKTWSRKFGTSKHLTKRSG